MTPYMSPSTVDSGGGSVGATGSLDLLPPNEPLEAPLRPPPLKLNPYIYYKEAKIDFVRDCYKVQKAEEPLL